MPVTDRHYNRQNLERAIPHIDQIQEYVDRVGNAFHASATEHYGEPDKWPQTYISVFEGLELVTAMCAQMKEILQQIHDGI